MKLIVEPDAGIAPVITAIKRATKSIDILIFRCDREELTRALKDAVTRGIDRACADGTHQSRRREGLRKLELELLEEV